MQSLGNEVRLTGDLLGYDVGVLLVGLADVAGAYGVQLAKEAGVRVLFVGYYTATALPEAKLALDRHRLGRLAAVLHLRLGLIVDVGVLNPQDDHHDHSYYNEGRDHADHHAQHRRQLHVLLRPLYAFKQIIP